MEDEENAAAGAPDDTSKPFSRLSLCDRGLRDVFAHCMSAEVKARVKELEAKVQEHERLQHELRGFMYLAPHQMPERPQYTRYHISTPDKTNVDLHLRVQLYQENGSFMDTFLRFSLKKVDEHWKMKNESDRVETRKIQITVKHVGSDEWTPVELFPFDVFPNAAFNVHKPEDGTNFNHGDQFDMRYVHSSGQSYPVSYDGTEATNYFPLTIRVIG